MNLNELRVLCTAISFATITAQGKSRQDHNVERINALAGLIEEFCCLNLPEAFQQCDERQRCEIKLSDQPI
jgi:hypothetical protein